jgi:hypothetical protein
MMDVIKTLSSTVLSGKLKEEKLLSYKKVLGLESTDMLSQKKPVSINEILATIYKKMVISKVAFAVHSLINGFRNFIFMYFLLIIQRYDIKIFMSFLSIVFVRFRPG